MTREFWQGIVKNKYQISSDPSLSGAAVGSRSDSSALLPELLEMLASPDSQLRDVFAYPILATWIQKSAFSQSELRSLLLTLEERLQFGLNEVETDRVFARSFAALVLAVLVNNQSLALEKAEVHKLLERVLDYFEREQDLRGFVQPQGWAHAVAHTADLLDEFAVNEHCQAPELEQILNAITGKVAAKSVWLFDEEDRLSYAAARVLGRGLLSSEFVQTCLENLAARVRQSDEQKSNNIPRHNAKGFLRSLYFQVLKLGPGSEHLETVLGMFKNLD